jgi:hypothetical protein
VLGSRIRLRVRQAGQRFVAFGWQQQALQVAAKCIALIAFAEQAVKVPGIGESTHMLGHNQYEEVKQAIWEQVTVEFTVKRLV